MIIYVDNDLKLEEAIDFLKKKATLGFDVETNGLDPLTNQVLLIQIGNEDFQYVFDVYKLGTGIYSILEVLQSEDTAKVAHNAKFDYGMIKSNFKIDLPTIRCTMIGEQLLTQGKHTRANLAAVIDKYLGQVLPKEARTSFIGMKLGDSFTPEQIEYAGGDIAYLIPLYKKIQALLNTRDMKELSELEYETVRVTADLELNGIFLDKTKWTILQNIAEKGAEKARKELDVFFVPHSEVDLFGGVGVNYNSPKQLTPLLEKITGETIPSTGEAALKRIKHPVIDALLTYREHQKKISTYGEKFFEKYVSSVDGRVHSDFLQLGADSGRYASKNPNLTNIPKEEEYRAAFVAQDPEYRIISADFSGQINRFLLTYLY